jgi:glycosyltransferase involved in cell wall biosynthesis
VYGYFVDQRWFDLAPGFVADLAIVREPEFNVAYWNVHSRRLELDGGRYMVDGRPLAFYHFSGFDPASPEALSRHQNRVSLSGNPVLARLCRKYAERTLREGFLEARGWPYTYGTLPGGVPFDDVLRRLYTIAEEEGVAEGSPFKPQGARALLDWLAAPSPGAPEGVHRLLAYLYGARADLRAAFPDLSRRADLDGLLAWADRDGKRQVPALGHLPLPERSGPAVSSPPARPSPPAAAELWGVNVVGYFRSELGTGEAARQVIGALDTQGVPVLPLHGDTIPLSRQGHPYMQFSHADAVYPVNLICMNADALPEFARQAGPWFFSGRHSIGLWFWEVSRFPDRFMGAFEHLDELWLPSAHVASAVAAASPVPTIPIKVPVEVPAVVPMSRADLGVPEGFLFLFSFDYRSVFERKNPLAVVDAFTRAFEPGEGAKLVIKCINAEADPVSHDRLLAAAAAHSDVHLISRYISFQEKNTLTATCDCFVSLHRSEGFGFTMAEAMYLGKPVIATGYSGNVDFMNADNSLLVRYRLVPIGPNSGPYPPEGEWAEPDVEHAGELMRRVFEDRQFAVELGVHAASEIRRTHSRIAAGEVMASRLNQLCARGAPPNAVLGEPVVASWLGQRVEGGPAAYAKPGRLRRALRRGVLRGMKPFTAYQQTINGELVRSLDAVGRELDRVRSRIARSDAAMLAGLRRQEPLQSLPPIVEVHSRQLESLPSIVDVHSRQLETFPSQIEALGRHVAALQDELSAPRFETDRALYLAMAELRRAYEAVGDQPRTQAQNGELTPWELRAFSQNGEDGVLSEIFARIGCPGRYFVEFGIESGREGTCVFLADVVGWRGLFMEADEDFYAELERKYALVETVTTLRAMVTPENIQSLLGGAGVPAEFDVLVIDVDGMDYWIWEALTDYRPRVVVIEYNSVLDPHRRLVQPSDHAAWDGTDFFGASLGAIRMLGEQKGYRLVHTELSGVNAFLVREDLAGGRFPPAQETPVRGGPNYFQSGYRHPRDPHARRYIDLDGRALEFTGAPSTRAS